MTLVIKQYTTDKYHIVMEWDKNNIYLVQVYPKIDKIFYGYPIRKMIYSLNEKVKAQATFNRYKRIYGGNSNVKN